MVVTAAVLSASLSSGASNESFTATVLPAGSPLPRTWEGESAIQPIQITIHIDRWSTPQEILAIKAAFDQHGEAAATPMLQSAHAGTLVPPPHLAFGVGLAGVGRKPTWRLNLAYAKRTQAGREALLITDRPLTLYDTSTVEQHKRTDLRLGAVVLELDENGRGQGRILPFARVQFHENGAIALEEQPAEVVYYPVTAVRVWKN